MEVDALGLIQILESDDAAVDFKEPVNYEALQLYDYPKIVKKPMDLSTVKVSLLKSSIEQN